METAIFIIVFAILFFGSSYLAATTVMKQWKLMKLAQPDAVSTTLGEKIKNVIVYVFLQKKLLKRPIRGIAHILVLYGFFAYGLHTASQFIGGFMADYTFYLPAFLGEGFEHIYDTFLDFMSVFVLMALAFFAIRRWVLKAKELHRPSGQSVVVIVMISSLMLFTLLGESAKLIVMHPESVSPIGTVIGNFNHISPIRISIATFLVEHGFAHNAEFLFHLGWWGHIVAVFSFMVFVPNSKHGHLIWAPVNFWFKKNTPKGAMSFLDTENATVWGAANANHFKWRNLMDGMSCIECGRCMLVCPANRTGKVLNPREIMLDMKHALMNKMPLVDLAIKNAAKEGKELSDEEIIDIEGTRVIDEYTSQEAIWDCTTCYACVEACPVGNTQVDAILEMRRSLVLNEGSMPNELAGAMTNMENQSNPWGVGSHKREEWTEGVDVKTMAQLKEAGESVDYLYWVGCAGAFDDRSIKISKAMVNILNKAGIKYGILGVEEQCTGDSARRGGNEYLYQTLAAANIETFNTYNVKKIITTCPHCFNTIANEYPQLGGDYEVVHHTDFINELIKEGKIKLDQSKTADLGNLTYHDSCYLGRYNDVYDSPRDVIQQATGKKVKEACDNHENGMCCSAGGGRMWMEEHVGEKIYVERTNQLLDTKADTLATACPFCNTMITDGVKFNDKEEEIKTLDIAEIVNQALV